MYLCLTGVLRIRQWSFWYPKL